MNTIVSRIPALLLVLHASLTWAQSLSAEDFAWRAPVSAPAGASLVRVEVPAQALAKLQSADARDVRIFNAKGEPVPFARITPTAPPAKPPEAHTHSYPALPLYATPGSSVRPGGSVQVQIEGERGRQSVWVRMDGEAAAGAQRLNSVLFDARHERKPLSALDVQATLPANTPVRVRASTSADLAVWTPAAVRGRLYRFDGEGAPSNLRLEFDRPLTLENRYLRLDWDGQEGVSISALTGILASEAPAPRRVRIALPPLRESGSDAAEISTGFATPIAAIGLSTPGDNTLLPVRVLGRNDNGQPWRQLGQTVVYRLGQNGETITNPPLELHGASARSLRIVATHDAKLGSAQLQAFAEFVPMELVFVASGQGPFMLAAGREVREQAALPLATVTGMLGERKVEDLPLTEVGTAVEAQPSRWATLWPGVPGKAALLWAVLGLGVLLLAGVAWSLARQMNQGKSEAS